MAANQTTLGYHFGWILKLLGGLQSPAEFVSALLGGVFFKYLCDGAHFKNSYQQSPDISGVLWVHIGGIIHPEFPKIVEFCRENDIFVIEDDAHAHGSSLNRVKAGNIGDAGCFSFFPSKVITALPYTM